MYLDAIINYSNPVGNKMKSDINSRAVIIFMRAPYRGEVKTRLARTIGKERAAQLYRLCAEAIVHEISELSKVQKYIFFADVTPNYNTDYLVDLGFKISIQEGASLGQRLENAFSRLSADGVKKALVVASDVPDLTANIVEEALNGLEDHDVVIGPSLDGGYYLIGLKEPQKSLFKGIAWGTKKVFRQTVDIADKKGLTIKYLPELIDFDTSDDLMIWLALDGNKNSAILDFVKALRL